MPLMQPKVKIGLFSIGLAAYWTQFPALKERLTSYGQFVCSSLSSFGAEIVDAGMVDSYATAQKASDAFISSNVDLIVCYVTTYATSSQIVAAVQHANRPVLILNLQPTAQLNYRQTGTAEWLANCQACCVPEIACAFERCGIQFSTVSGLLGLKEQTPGALANEVTHDHPAAAKAWGDIKVWIDAVSVKRSLSRCRIGFLGHTYNGMLDLYSDITQLVGQFGVQIELIEMDELAALVETVTDIQVTEKRQETLSIFDISDDVAADPLAKKPDEKELDWALRVAVALDLLAKKYSLGALAYYYQGLDANTFERIGAGLILGCSLLTARGIPCSGEGDLKNAIAMKVMDLLGAGGSFTEIYALDFIENFVMMGHDGPFHTKIAEGRPILRGLSLYHGKSGNGVSVEAEVQNGPVTILGLTQTIQGKLKWLCCEGWSLPGERLQIGNTNSRIRFTKNENDEFDPGDWMNRWASEGPTHHVALAVGHQKSAISLLARIFNMPLVTI